MNVNIEEPVFTESRQENFIPIALDLVDKYSLSSTPPQCEELMFFDEPISAHTKNETTENLIYLDPEVTTLPSIYLFNTLLYFLISTRC